MRLANQRALTQTSKPEGPEVISLDEISSIGVPLINARCSETISSKSDVETAGKLLDRAWDVCATKVVRTAEKRPACENMSEERARRERYTHENQEQIQTIPSLGDHIVVKNLTLVQVYSPRAGIGSQFLVDRILGINLFKIKLAYSVPLA